MTTTGYRGGWPVRICCFAPWGATIVLSLEGANTTYSAGTRPQDIRPIEGEPGSFGIDSGEYRILYRVEDDVGRIRVWGIRHRKDVYRNL